MMTKERQSYDREFKQKAVELSFARGNAKEIAEELGIRPELLYRWRREYQQYDKNSFPGKGKPKMTDLERENAELKKELRDAKKVTKSSYYHWLCQGPSDRWKENEELLIEIMDIFEESKDSYGSIRITRELKARGRTVGKNRVANMMRAANLRVRKPKKFKATTDSKHNYPLAPNILDREFFASNPGEVWVSNMTYVRTKRGWLYLTVIIDLYDRKVIGWSMSKGMSAGETVIPAWIMATRNRPITQKLIFHSDRGSQYACNEFTKILKANNLIVQSMSRKGNCWDNAVAESFFKTIKVEWIYNQNFINQEQAQLSIFEWIESWYNRRRRHLAIGYQTIEEFERNNHIFRNAA